MASALFAAAALLGMELVFSQRLQLVLGMSPIEAALYILPLPLAAFIAGPLAGWLLPKVGSARLLFVSLLVSGLGMGGYLFSYDGGLAAQIASLCVLGVGIGATMTVSYTHLPEKWAGTDGASRRWKTLTAAGYAKTGARLIRTGMPIVRKAA